MLRREHGLDIARYAPGFLASSLERRWQAMPGMTQIAYLQLLEGDRAEAETLIRSLDIHHSEFFRDPLVFALLEQRLLPNLASVKNALDQTEIRVWSAGCASGAEAYSIAILLRELSDHRRSPIRFRLFATDSSAEQLARAQAGTYDLAAMGKVALRHLNRWFHRQEDHYIVAPELRELVDFSAYDLLDEHRACPCASIFGEFDIVFCCNILFYYQSECQDRILDKLRRCLAPDGYLVTSDAEREIVQNAGFQAMAPPTAIYRAWR